MKAGRFLIVLLCFVSFSGYTQEDTVASEQQKVTVIKNDGAVYTGYILEDDAREILIRTEQVGLMYIPKHFIKEIRAYDPQNDTKGISQVTETPVDSTDLKATKVATDTIRKTEVVIQPDTTADSVLSNHFSTRNIYSDNAFSLRPGEAFLKTTIVGLEVGFPITKNWSAGVITSFWGAPLGIKTKISFPVNTESAISIDAGYGTMAFGSWMNRGIRDGGGYISSTFTIGNRMRNFSVKAGYSLIHQYQQQWFFDETQQTWLLSPIGVNHDHIVFTNLGGMLDIHSNVWVVGDFTAAIIPGQGFFAAVGCAARLAGHNPINSWQIGASLMMTDGEVIPIPIPHISYTYTFNKVNR